MKKILAGVTIAAVTVLSVPAPADADSAHRPHPKWQVMKHGQSEVLTKYIRFQHRASQHAHFLQSHLR